MTAAEEALVCPACARSHPRSERFCAACGMPLVDPARGESAASERRRKARKIKPQYAEGQLVKVARAANRAEAEFIAGLLLEEGIPSVQRSSFGAAIGGYASELGARDVLVPQSGADAAREALAWERPSL